jgi:hypothetical protein
MKTGDQRTATNDGDDGGNETHDLSLSQKEEAARGVPRPLPSKPAPPIPRVGGLGYRSICCRSVKITLFAQGGAHVGMDPRRAARIRHCLRPQKGGDPGFRTALTEEDRFAIAQAISAHLKLCKWEFSKPSERMQ